MQNPKEANATLGGGKVEVGFKKSYREFVTLPSAQREFRKLFLPACRPRAVAGAISLHDRQGPDRMGRRGLVDPARCTEGAGHGGLPAQQRFHHPRLSEG